MPVESNPILLYDGVCGLCNRLVQFVLKRDHGDVFRFASLQSAFAARLLERHGANPGDLDTVYLLLDYQHPGEHLLKRSEAVIQVLRQVGSVSAIAGTLLEMLPRWLGDRAYDLVARNRYRVFGKYQACLLPEERHRRKFLDM